jgi:hypothetical protein
MAELGVGFDLEAKMELPVMSLFETTWSYRTNGYEGFFRVLEDFF